MRTLLRNALLGAILLVLVGGVVLASYAYFRGISARAHALPFEDWIAEQLVALATPAELRNRENPLKSTALLIAQARDHFADHCAFCHANDGSGKTEAGKGMFPPVPDLRDAESQELTDGEMFAIIRDGIRFSGMSGWGGTDEENWKLVLFLRHLPQLTADERRYMNEVNHLDG